MSEYIFVKTIEALIQSELAIKVKNSYRRIKEEERSLMRLKQTDSFLSSYNEIIRYMFIITLNSEYDIKQSKVHYALKIFLTTYLCIEENDISNLIAARHAMKYHGSFPPFRLRVLIKSIAKDLSLVYQQKFTF